MTTPAFATVAFTVPVGKQASATVIATMSQALGNTGASPGLGPLAKMGWSASVVDLTSLSADGLTVRRMITFATPPAPAGGLPPYRNAAAVKSCLRNLYTRQLEGYCGTKVTGLEPVAWDTPLTILGSALDSWWDGDGLATAPVGTWPSLGPVGAGVELDQANPLDRFTTTTDALLGGRNVAVSTGASKFMQPAVLPVATAQPWSIAFLGLAAVGAAGKWLGGGAGTDCEFIRGANETFTTDGGANTLVGPAADGAPHLIGGDANGAASALYYDANAAVTGPAGAGTPQSITALADNAGANNLAGELAFIVTGASGVLWTADQRAQLYAFAQGYYGLNYW